MAGSAIEINANNSQILTGPTPPLVKVLAPERLAGNAATKPGAMPEKRQMRQALKEGRDQVFVFLKERDELLPAFLRVTKGEHPQFQVNIALLELNQLTGADGDIGGKPFDAQPNFRWCHLIIVRICLPRVSGWNRMRNHKFQQEVQDDRTFQIFLP